MPQTIAEFSIPYIQILNEKGDICADLPSFAHDTQTLLELYRVMMFTRLFDKKAIALQRTGKMGTYAPVNGQEAVATAVGHAMRPTDVLIPYYRDYAAQFQRGVKPSDILSYWGGDERGSALSSNPNSQDLPICVPIATQCLHAAGVAFSFQYRKEERVAVVCIGDGGTSEGDFYEAINVAGVWKLPVVFVINNNQWAISVPLQQQTATQTLAQKAIAAGFQGIVVDGNDILALRQELGLAIEKARKHNGPTLIEARSYRLSDHTTADDATRYQPQTEVESAQLREPLLRFKRYLETHHQWDQKQEDALILECNQTIQTEVDHYLQKPPQPTTAMFDYHYATLPDYLLEQRAIAMEASEHA
ncbi:MAG TPA: pyruvate dehydrogenase (acetyl-transferring) E1 component subunit alpha [Legionellaceae bacterium]|nr:pyruvate dehydrogenase (acetyl-transferring) E1 component subunit alpha [Legionellaceae bacterium]